VPPVTDPRIWALGLLAAYALVLAPTLTAPPLERESWRETMVLEVGRNFCREHGPLWEPRVDARGAGDGITGTEFPWLAYAQGRFGCGGTAQIVTARLLGLLFALLAGVAVFALTLESLPPRVAVLALALFLTSPLVVYYGRSVMPDVPALSLALAGLWTLRIGLRSTGGRAVGWFALSAVAFCLGILTKLPVIVFGLPAAVSVLRSGHPRRPKAIAAWLLYAIVAVVPAALWYDHARRLQEASHLDYFLVSRTFHDIVVDWLNPEFYRLIFVQHAFDSYAFPVATGFAALAVVRRRTHMPAWLGWTGLAVLAYFLLAGYTAAWHPYYGLPAVPVIATLAAWEVDHWLGRWPRWRGTALAGFAAASLGWGLHRAWHWFPSRGVERPYVSAKRALDAAFPGDERIAAFGAGNPRLFWEMDRRGWLDPGGNVSHWLASGAPLESAAVVIDTARASEMPYAECIAGLEARPCKPLWRSPEVEAWQCPR
jgi:hypothetical protein